MTILEGNRLIAEFRGATFVDCGDSIYIAREPNALRAESQ